VVAKSSLGNFQADHRWTLIQDVAAGWQPKSRRWYNGSLKTRFEPSSGPDPTRVWIDPNR
jgi:hypothetical protein